MKKKYKDQVIFEEFFQKDKPEAGKIYALTDAEGKPSIANGNTWAQSEVKKKEEVKTSSNTVFDNYFVNHLGMKKEIIEDGIVAFTLDSKKEVKQ